MSISLAFRCFFRAFKDADFATKLLAGKTEEEKPQQPRAALELLAVLQEEGRLIDFLQEDIGEFEDEQIGAAVRDIHNNCRRTLAEYFEITPVVSGQEGEESTVDKGFDPRAIKLVGKVEGEPPFTGVIRHHGWKVANAKTLPSCQDPTIIAQAELEVGE